MPGMAVTAAIDAVFTTHPGSPDARMRGTNAWMPWMTPHRSTSMIRCHSESGSSHELPMVTMPALFMHTCSFPNRSTAVSAARSIASGSVTSTTREWTSPPASASRVACSARLASSRSVISTRIPAATNASVVANPIPLAAPVTTALRPANSSNPAIVLPLGACSSPRKR